MPVFGAESEKEREREKEIWTITGRIRNRRRGRRFESSRGRAIYFFTPLASLAFGGRSLDAIWRHFHEFTS